MFTSNCSLTESMTKTLPVGNAEENKEFQMQTDEGKTAADTAAGDSEQKEGAADQPFTSDQSESPEQPADTAEEPEPAETASNTE